MILLSLVACLAEADLKGNATDAPSESLMTADVELRVDVLPSAVRDASDRLRVLPETVFVQADADRISLDIALATPQEQLGTVSAYALNPTVGVLPGADVAVTGTVHVTIPDTLQTYAAQLDEDGRFQAWVLPEREYLLQVVPDDPMLPAYEGPLEVGLRPSLENLDLGAGVPIYGQVTSASGPVPRARVVVETTDGHRSAAATTDEFGIYQLRVSPGTWTVASLGRDLNQDPILRQRSVVVGEAGARVDFEYPTDLGQVLAEGRVVEAGAGAIGGATVRLEALSLFGYEDQAASWSTEVPVAGNGVFLAKVVPGHYRLDVLPPLDDERLGPTSIEVDLDEGTGPVGDVALAAVGRLRARVVDTSDQPLVAAQVTCADVGFDGDSRTAFSDEEGWATLDVPRVELDCDVVPPGDRTDLAAFRARIVPEGPRAERRFELTPGQVVTGRVQIEGSGEASAVIEVRGPDGALLGFDVTDEDGAFDVRVDLRTYIP
ncbi:MAG: carboxypeptidase regulatory-like domain-containing protein [Myxococcales bacterium]|nr:carboxypeptidase regulatory-like domain-containing protein [Myxococcales bacterium]